MKTTNLYFLQNRFASLVIGCLAATFANTQNYYQTHYDGCQRALAFYKSHRSEFVEAAKGTCLNARQLFCVVAPEISRYSEVQDWMELGTMKLFYLQFGKGYADFSIGPFQMKPSFIERMERQVEQDQFLRNSRSVQKLANQGDDFQRRKNILDRLQTLTWQFKYLQLFCWIVDGKYPRKTFSSKSDELAFYATVYNAGFHKNLDIIEQEMQKKRFPRDFHIRYNYAAVSKEFFEAYGW